MPLTVADEKASIITSDQFWLLVEKNESTVSSDVEDAT